MKFYELKQQLNNMQWTSLGFFKKRAEAEKAQSLYNTTVVVYPTKIVEHKFRTRKDLEG